MASGNEASCANDPNFAIICSFFEKFSSMLNIQQPDIQMLQEWLENSDEVASGLRDLHIKLLRKMRKTVHETAWETALAKFCYQYSAQDAWEIERFGYKKSSLKVKLRILTAILEYQFQYNGKFRNKFSNLSAEELRSEPIGRDRLGHSYWLTQDPSCNFRIYQEHLDEEIWQVVASNRSEMETLISRLKGNEVVLPSLVGVIDEDSSSNSCANALIKPPPPEEQDDSQSSSIGSNSKAKIPNIKIKIESRSIVEPNGDMNGKENVKKEDKSKHGMEENGNDDEVGVVEEESGEEEDEGSELEEESCEGEEQGKQMSEGIGKNNDALSELGNGVSAIQVEVIANGKNTNPRKIKLLAINQSKLPTAGEDKSNTKKRLFKENTNGDLETEQPELKKTRPTLSDNRRDKKSKYEKLSDEEGGEGDDDEDEDDVDEDESEDEDDVEFAVENEEDNDDNGETEKEEVEEEETEMEGIKKENGKDGAGNEKENVVGAEIEEKVLIVKGEGSGEDCETSSTDFLRSINIGCEEDDIVGEAIEEEIMFVYGEGNGRYCLVGNTHKEKNESDTILGKQSKSIQKEKKTKQLGVEVSKPDENKSDENIFSMTNGEGNAEKMQASKETTRNEKNVEDTKKTNECAENNEGNVAEINSKPKDDSDEMSLSENNSKFHSPSSRQQSKAKYNKQEDFPPEIRNIKILEQLSGFKKSGEESPSAEEELSGNAEVVHPANSTKVDLNSVHPDLISKKNNSGASSFENAVKSETDWPHVQEHSSKAVLKERAAVIAVKSVDSQPENEEKTTILPELYSGNCRKRRLSEEKQLHDLSESESDLNSDSAAPPTEEEEDVGGKRPKMRLKVVKSDVRKKIEKMRKSKEPKSTSEEDSQCTAQESSNIDNGSVDETDPLHISDKDDVLAAKAAEIESINVPSPILIHTRSSRRNSPGATIETTTLRGRGRKKPGKQRYTRRTERIPSLKIETTVGEETKSDDDHGSIKMPLLEAESNGQPVASPSKDTQAQRKPRGRKRDIDTSNIIDSQTDTPVRQSRRIAQLKIREEAERRKLEEEALKKMKAEFKKKKQEEKSAKGIAAPTESSEHTEEESEAEEGKKFIPKKKGARGWKKSGWSSGPDEPEEDDEYDLHHDRYDSERGSPLFKSDHEFSPESDIEDESQAVPLKRARTVRKEGAEDDGNVNFDESCQKCGKSDHPEWILLCDKCDKGYHCSCLSPVLFIIPEGDWFCPPCQQEQLIMALEKQLVVLDDQVEQKRVREEVAKQMEIEKLKEEEKYAKDKEHLCEEAEESSRPNKNRTERAKRRRRPKFRKSFIADDEDESEDDFEDESRSSASGSTSNDSDSGSSETSDSEDNEPIYKLRKRRQVNVSYRLNEYEDLINSAIKEEMDEVAGAGNLGRGKDISTIIEADKEEKLRQKQMCSYKDPEEVDVRETQVKSEIENGEAKSVATELKDDEDEEEERIAPVKCRAKHSSRHAKKKGRKLNNLDISSDDDGSDEDFKTSSYETEEDESISVSTDSDSSLEVYRKRGKKGRKRDKKEKGRRPQRRAARERRRLDDFIVDDSDWSDDTPKRRRKVKQKQNWELQDTESEEDLSEQVDSEELCDDTTDSEDSDGCWRPSKRRRTKGKSKATKPKASNQLGAREGKQPRKFNRKDSSERVFKAKTKKKTRRETDDSDEDVPRTRGKRFTYLDSFEEESSDDGIKPGVKRPDTPPEEREKFIKKQEEIKRMLAEKNAEAAKAVATPTLVPMDSLSTVPMSVIKGAKALDIDYLQRKGELNSEEGDTDFDEDLPDDFDPEAMDEEEIAKMMEEEDFAQQQLKLAGDVVRQKRKDNELPQASDARQHPGTMIQVGKEPPVSLLQEPPRKRLPMPTTHPPLSGMPRFLPPGGRSLYDTSARHQLSTTGSLSMQSVIQGRSLGPALAVMSGASQSLLSNTNLPGASSALLAQTASNDQMKPRGRRKKITPLRDTLQKQQAAAAAAAAASVASSQLANQGVGSGLTVAKELTAISSEKSVSSVPIGPLQLSVAQPPQLYAPPTSTPPSVITRMPQQLSPVTRPQQPLHAQQPPHRSLQPPFPEQNSRYYSPPNQIAQHRMSIIRHGGPPMRHHALGPSFAGGPPPLRSANPRIPASVGNAVNRQSAPRPLTSFSHNEQFVGARALHPNAPHAYRPPLYGTPGYPPAPPQQPQTPMHPTAPDYPAVPTSYGPTPAYSSPFYPPPQNIGPSHSTPPPPAAIAVPVSSPVPISTLPPPAVAPPSSAAIPPPNIVSEQPTPPHTIVVAVAPVTESTILASAQASRSQASVLETFDSKSRSPNLESEVNHSPYLNSGIPDENDEENSGVRPPSNSTSEFSGLVSYFSSQHDDLNS